MPQRSLYQALGGSPQPSPVIQPSAPVPPAAQAGSGPGSLHQALSNPDVINALRQATGGLPTPAPSPTGIPSSEGNTDPRAVAIRKSFGY